MTRFEDLRLIEPLLRAVREEGYDHPTPIQEKTVVHVLEGRDLLGCAQTGTGKTAAFALPILQRLHGAPVPSPRHVRVLVLSPTRELAAQIGQSFAVYGSMGDPFYFRASAYEAYPLNARSGTQSPGARS